MARKRRAPSPPPPPSQVESSAEESGSEEESSRAPAAQNPSKTRQPHPAAADLSEDKSDSNTDAQALQLRQVPRAPTKPPHLAPRPGSNNEEEEDEDPEPEPLVQKAATPAGKSKAEPKRKRPVSDPAPSGKAKKAKAGAEKAAAPEPKSTSSGKVKNGKTKPAAPEPNRGAKLEKLAALDPSPDCSMSQKIVRPWTKGDEMKILEALAGHVKNEGELPKTDTIFASLSGRLNRKNCTRRDIYEKVRRLKDRYEKAVNTGALPSKEDDLQMFNLSEAVWGDKAKAPVVPGISQNDGAVTKRKGLANKKKIDGNSGAPKEATTSAANQHGDTNKGTKKGTKEKTDRGPKSRLSKEATTTANPSKSKEDQDARNTSNSDKEEMDRGTKSLIPKDSTTDTHNGDTMTNSKEGAQNEETKENANVHDVRRSFGELQQLYSNLASYVERIEVQHPCGETLKRAFGYIDDKKAKDLESKIKKLRVNEAKDWIRQADVKRDVLSMLIGLVD